MNNNINHEHKVIDNTHHEGTKIGNGYVTSKRSHDRVTVGWSSSLDLPETLAAAQEVLGEPIWHLNSQATFRHPETSAPISADHHTPVILDWANKLPTDHLQLPHNGMAIGWSRVPEPLRFEMHAPYQIYATAEQHIARAIIRDLIRKSGSPDLMYNLDSLLAGLEYTFQPLSLGESKRDEEWKNMHQVDVEDTERHAA